MLYVCWTMLPRMGQVLKVGKAFCRYSLSIYLEEYEYLHCLSTLSVGA